MSSFPTAPDNIRDDVVNTTPEQNTHPELHNQIASAINSIEISLLDGMPLLDKGGELYNVKAYGAVGDGLTDDTAAIQAALDAVMYSPRKLGTVFIPGGTYLISSTLRVYRSDNAQQYVNILGDGLTATILRWIGSTSGVCITTWQNKNTTWQGFQVINGVAAGTTIGMLFTNYPGLGMGTNGQVFTNVGAQSFNTGWQLGEASGAAAADMVFLNCHASSCGTGFYLAASNTLDLQFIEVELGFNNVGILASTGGSLNVFGGACSFNGSDFKLLGGGAFSLRGVRSESVGWGNTSGRFAEIAATTAYTGCVIDACHVAAPDPGTPGHDGIVIDVGNGGCVAIKNNALPGGGIQVATQSVAPASNSVEITGNLINDIAHPGAPFKNGGGTRDLLYYVSKGNVRWLSGNGDYRPFPDEEGTLVGGVLTPTFRSNGRGAAVHSRIRTLRGLSSTTTRRNNLNGSATFATAGTAPVVFGTAEIQSLVITGASSGTFKLNFNGYDTPATLNYNASIGQIQAALVGLWNIAAGGVVVTGGPLPNTAVTITFAGPLVGGGAQNLLTATNSTVVGGTPTITRTTTGTGNPPEPDASYKLELAGSANETFYWSAKATTGFVINSSNASSTATVDWFLSG